MVLCVEGWSRDGRGDQEVWSRGMSINLHSRGAKPAAGEEAGRRLEDGSRTSSPGPTVTILSCMSQTPLSIPPLGLRECQGRGGGKNGKVGRGVQGPRKTASTGHDTAIVFMSSVKPR